MKPLSMGELRAKALKELSRQIEIVTGSGSDITYHRACATAWAYWSIGLLGDAEVYEYIEKFASVV